MTTIAFKDGVLAADSQCTQGGLASGQINKVAKSASGWLVAGCGSAVYTQALRDWALNVDDKSPPLPPKDSYGLAIKPDGEVVHLEHGGQLSSLIEPFVAMGSGRDYAYAVMAFGGSAEDAVRIASGLDVYTGGPIRSVSLGAAK